MNTEKDVGAMALLGHSVCLANRWEVIEFYSFKFFMFLYYTFHICVCENRQYHYFDGKITEFRRFAVALLARSHLPYGAPSPFLKF